MMLVLSLTAAMIVSACGLINVTNGSGTITTETRGVSGFMKIDLRTAANVELTIGSAEEVTVTADDNLQTLIRTTVENGWLIIDTPDNQNYRPSRAIVVTVTLPILSDITLSGAGDITASGVETDSLVVNLNGAGNISIGGLDAASLAANISGAGDLVMTGSVNEQVITISGAGNYQAFELSSTSAVVIVSGAGSASVNATGTLDASISGAGNITYTGSPTVTQSVTGAGRIAAQN
jgi:hypothetical protein